MKTLSEICHKLNSQHSFKSIIDQKKGYSQFICSLKFSHDKEKDEILGTATYGIRNEFLGKIELETINFELFNNDPKNCQMEIQAEYSRKGLYKNKDMAPAFQTLIKEVNKRCTPNILLRVISKLLTKS